VLSVDCLAVQEKPASRKDQDNGRSSIDLSIATIENIIDELKRHVSRMHDAEWNLLNTIGERTPSPVWKPLQLTGSEASQCKSR